MSQPSPNGHARVAPGAEGSPVAAASATPQKSAADRAWVADLRRISDLCIQLGHTAAALVENLERELAPRAETSLMSNDVKPNVIEPPKPELLTTKELCGLLRTDARTLRRQELLGEIPAPIRRGRRKYWRCTTVESWLAEREENSR